VQLITLITTVAVLCMTVTRVVATQHVSFISCINDDDSCSCTVALNGYKSGCNAICVCLHCLQFFNFKKFGVDG